MAGSTISTDPAVLAAASRCFDTCIPPGAQKPVQTYLWAQIAGITDPAVVLTNARCFMSCVPPGGQLALQAYLAAVLAGGSLDPSTLANAARCFSSCIPPGANGAVITYALANKAGGSTDPSTLVNAARCFSSCIPMGFQLAAQNYLMAVAAGVSTDPQVLLSSAAYACFNCNLLPGMAGSVTASSIAAYAAGGGPAPPGCTVPTGLAAGWQLDTTTIVTWDVPPAGNDYTEVWSSTDNVTFVLAATVAAPGVTTTLLASVAAPYVKIRFCTGAIPPAPAAPTTFAFASEITFTNVVSTWAVPAAGVLFTEVWTSTDNITFTLATTVAAPGVTANAIAVPAIGSTVYCKVRANGTGGYSAFTSVLLFTRTDWETRAATNLGGAINAGAKAIENNFYSALANAGILSKMINVGFFQNQGGNQIPVCLTPIVKTVGTNAWANNNMGDAMVNSDGVNAVGGPGVGAQPGILGTDFPSDNNGGYTVYAFTGAEVLNACCLGYTNNAGSISTAFQIQTGGNTRAAMWNDTSRITVASNGAGYYSLNRTGATTLDLYYAKVAAPHASIGSSAAAAGSRSANALSFFAVNAFEVPSLDLFTTSNRLRLIAVHQGLTAAESLLFYNVIVASIVQAGGTPV